MNYHLRDALLGFIGNQTLSATEFAGRMGYMKGSIHPEAYDVLWNLIDCHDTPRFMHVVKGNKKKQQLAASIQILSHGCPMLYYGDEVGMTGGNDPDCRRGMLWREEKQDRQIFSYYKKLLALRKSEPCIINGEQKILLTDDEKGLVIEERSITDNKKVRRVVIIYHNGKETEELKEYAGRHNLLTGTAFEGQIKAYETVVLLMEGENIG
jgi:glycosidase